MKLTVKPNDVGYLYHWDYLLDCLLALYWAIKMNTFHISSHLNMHFCCTNEIIIGSHSVCVCDVCSYIIMWAHVCTTDYSYTHIHVYTTTGKLRHVCVNKESPDHNKSWDSSDYALAWVLKSTITSLQTQFMTVWKHITKLSSCWWLGYHAWFCVSVYMYDDPCKL